MPDLFGKKQLGRATNGGRFYATPTERVEAGAVYFPDESSLLFGVAEYAVEAGNLGAFATEGTFVFEKPSDWLDTLGRKVFFRPSSGEIVNQDKKGDVLIGFQIFANVPDDKLGVVLTTGENSVVIIVTSTADSGAGSLRQAIADAQDGDVILFDPIVFPTNTTTTIYLSSYLTVAKSISIYGGESDGQGGYTSGAKKLYYVYREIDGVQTKVYIDDNNPTLEGETTLFDLSCRVALDGQEAVRCIYSNSSNGAELTISGLAFNNGANPSGGGFSANYNTINTLTNCAFNGCVSTQYDGAGVYSAGTSQNTFSNCTFVNCTAERYGGGFRSVTSSEINLNGCVFDNCTSISGGAFYMGDTSKCIGNNCSIVNCSAGSNGGGFYVHTTKTVAFNNCTVVNCHADSAAGAFYSAGNSVVVLTDCVISDISSNYGAGVYTAGTSQTTLNRCTLTNCVADTYGGGICTHYSSHITLTDCTISNCSTKNNGGGIYALNSSSVAIYSCNIDDCHSNAGGGIYISNTSQNIINDCIITNCDANGGGGGIALAGTSQSTVNDCTITGCSAVHGGGIYSIDSSQNVITNCVISGCSVTQNGGGFYSRSTSQNTLSDCTITGNTSDDHITKRDVIMGETSVAIINGTNFGALRITQTAQVTFKSGITTVDTLTLLNSSGVYATLTINDGAALTLTGTATIDAATFTSDGRGYLAVAAGIDTSAATLSGVVLCAYGAGLKSFEISADGASWTADDLTTPILLEQKGDGDVWTTLDDDATGGSYSDSFAIGTTLRAFDGVRFFVASLDAYWQVEPFVVASNGGGGAGDASPSWTISDATITPNAEEV